MTNTPPALWSVLTTRSTTADVGVYKHAREVVMRAVRRRWSDAQNATLLEFTTGMGTRSGGERRPHFNDMWKGVPVGDADELHAVLSAAWCAHVDAAPRGQYVGAIAETGGLMRYLALHFQKESQQPPVGWRGHRFRTSRGYLAQPMAAAREEARTQLRFRRELWRAEQQGLEGEDALVAAQRAAYEAAELGWSLVRLQPLPIDFDADGLPSAWTQTVVPV
jgi:hypothetical protein